MDLQQEWNKLQETNLAAPPLSEADIREALRHGSRAPLAAVKRVIRFRLYAVVAYLLLAMGFMWYNWNEPEKLPIALIILLYYSLALVFSGWQLWQVQQKALGMDGNLLHTLQAYHQVVKNSIRIDAILGWFIYPMSFALGFFYALIRPDRGIVDILQNPKFMLPLLLGILVVTPLFWWFTKLVNRKLFGDLLAQLEGNINVLKEKE